MIAVKTCGKLYWAGEYAILEPGQLALIKAIPIYMKGEIAFSETYRIYSDMFNFAVDLTPNPDYSLIQETIALVEDFLTYRGRRQNEGTKRRVEGITNRVCANESLVVVVSNIPEPERETTAGVEIIKSKAVARHLYFVDSNLRGPQ